MGWEVSARIGGGKISYLKGFDVLPYSGFLLVYISIFYKLSVPVRRT